MTVDERKNINTGVIQNLILENSFFRTKKQQE